MVPTKSVSGILFPAEESFASCQLCPRENCPNRRAPYDPELFDRKFRAPVVQSDTRSSAVLTQRHEGHRDTSWTFVSLCLCGKNRLSWSTIMTLAERKAAWEQKSIAKVLAKAPERSPKFETSSGICVERVYTPDHEAELCPELGEEYLEKLGLPGEYPFTRGVQPTMYRGRFWTMRQYAGFGTAAESNQRYRYLLAQGQTGLSVAFDLPTQIGYDADDPLALGEVGKVGVAISSLADMEVLLDQIPLDKVSISMTINAPASILLAMVIAVAQKQGVPEAACAGPCRTTS